MKQLNKREQLINYEFKRVSKKHLESIDNFLRKAGVALYNSRYEGVVRRGLFNSDEYVERLYLNVTDSNCEDFLLYLEEPLDRSAAVIAPQIEIILKDYYKRLYRSSDELIEKLSKKLADRAQAYVRLCAMDDDSYKRFILGRRAAFQRCSEAQGQSDKDIKRLNAILKFNPFGHLKREPQERNIRIAWYRYLESRLKDKRDLRRLGYDKKRSHRVVNGHGFKYFPDKMIGIDTTVNCYETKGGSIVQLQPPKPSKDIKDKLNGRQRGLCNGCLDHFAVQHFELDHIVPLARGGHDTDGNLQLLCSSCNRIKGDRPMGFLLAKLRGVG